MPASQGDPTRDSLISARERLVWDAAQRAATPAPSVVGLTWVDISSSPGTDGSTWKVQRAPVPGGYLVRSVQIVTVLQVTSVVWMSEMTLIPCAHSAWSLT